MDQQHKAENIIRELARNAALLRSRIEQGELQEATRLVGERVALIEALRELRDAKVSLASSDMINEMTSLMKNIENDVSESSISIRTRLTSLMKELATMRGARKIAAYAVMRQPAHPISIGNERDKKQGGRYGY